MPDRPAFVARPDRATAQAAAYDFARPRSVSTRHARALNAANEALATELAATLTLSLDTPVQARTLSADEVTVQDFLHSRARPASLARMRLGAGGPALALDLGAAFSAFLVQRHFGGTDGLDPDATRALSDLERAVLERHWLPLVGVAFAGAWTTVPPVADVLGADPDRFELGLPTDPALVVELELTLNGATVPLTVAYPAPTARLLLDGLATVPHAAPPPDPDALSRVPVDLRVVLGRTRVPLGDLATLAAGDVIPLGSAPDAALEVWSGATVRYRARAGTQGRHLAIEITALSHRSPDR